MVTQRSATSATVVQLSGNVITWSGFDIAVGASVTVTFDAFVEATGEYLNIAEVTASDQFDPDSTPDNDDGDQSEDDEDNEPVVPVPIIDLELDKQVDNQFPFAGENVTFTIELTNLGPSVATGVVVTDQLPSGFIYAGTTGNYNPVNGEWNVGNLGVGEVVTLDIIATVLSSGNWMNLAEVSAANEQDIDSTPDNGVDTDNDGIVQDDAGDEDDGDGIGVAPQAIIDLELTKEVTPASTTVGGTVTFTLEIVNQGPNNATGVLVEDILPDGYNFVTASADYNPVTGIWDVGALGVGNSETIFIEATVNETGEHENIAEVSAADQPDVDSAPANDDGDQSEDDEDSAEVIIDVVIDLELDKSVSPSSVMVGEPVTFTIDVTNQGPSTATGVTVLDQLEDGFTYVSDSANGDYDPVSGIWTIGTISAGQTVSLDIVVTINEDGAYTNFAEVCTANEDDLDSTPCDGDEDDGEDDEDEEEVNVECELTIEVLNIVCDPGNDLAQTSDDTYTFEVLVDGTGISDEWTATIAGVTTTGDYGQIVAFGPYNIEQVGDITFQVIDADDPDCSEFVVIEAPETCSDQCLIIADYDDVECNDNGTPGDPTDDVFFFDITVTENFNTGSGWTASVNGNVVVNFSGYLDQSQGQNVGSGIGGFPIAGSADYPVVNGLLEVLITDFNDPTCTTTIFVQVPETCSDDCGIIVSDISTVCDDNNTPTDPTDDTFSVTLTLTGNNASNGWNASNGDSGNYGTVTLDGFAIGDGSDVSITFTDQADPTCTTTIIVTPPPTCSDQCAITAEAVNVQCDDNGTPTNPMDDTYTFDVIVTAVNSAGNGWTDGNGNGGAYGTLVSYGPFSIMDVPNVFLSIQDVDDASCTTDLSVTAPSSCSDQCAIAANVAASPYCDDNGTPSDPSDDVYFFDVMVMSTNNTSGTWVATGNVEGNDTGAYGDLVTFGPYAPGETVLITFLDSQDPNCLSVVTEVIPTETCSEVCMLAAVVPQTELCDDNGTPFDGSDDQWYFIVELSGTNTSGCWVDSEGNTGNAIPALISYGPYPVSQQDVTVTISDCDDPNCSVTVSAQSPGPCLGCDIDVEIVDIECLDNGTPLDPDDDQYQATVIVTPMGAYSNLGWRWKQLPNATPWSNPLPYGTPVVIGVFDIVDGDVDIRITDAGNSGCDEDITLIAPLPCSESCDLQASYINQECNDNGTPDDPSDDTYSFELVVTNSSSTGASWFATLQGVGSITGTFNDPYLIEGIPANDPTVILNITDANNPNCVIDELIVPPTGPCSTDCTLDVAVTQSSCDDNGTPSDPSDDTYSVTINIAATNAAGTAWTALVNGVLVSGDYGDDVTIANIPATETTNIENIQDNVDPSCTAVDEVVPPTGSCSDVCNLTSTLISLDCQDNGTPADPTDDFYLVTFSASAVNPGASNQYTVLVNGVANNTFDYGNGSISLPANGQSVILTFEDADNANCTDEIDLGILDPCSDAPPCSISADIIDVSVVCDDGGTIGDADDDTFTVEVVVTNSGTGSSWTSVDNTYGVTNTGGYGVPVVLGPYPASDYDNVLTITITDLDDPTCVTSVDVVIPQCNDCTITGNIINKVCDDQGTTDPNDDTFTFDLYITGDNVGTTWTSTDPTVPAGTFGDTVTFGPYVIMDYLPTGADITFNITPDENDNCELTVLVDPPQTCSPCGIGVDIDDPVCDDNGTPNDSSDDTYTFVATVLPGGAPGSFALYYENGSTIPVVVMYNVPVTYGPYPVSGDTDITWTDGIDPGCAVSETIPTTGPCSVTPTCEIAATSSVIDCIPNGPGIADDQVFIEVVVTAVAGINPGDTWVADNGFSGEYDQPLTFGPLPAGIDLSIVLSNVGDADCSTTLVIDIPDECAVPCNISANAFNIACDDNGTATVDDDSIRFDLLVIADFLQTWDIQFGGEVLAGGTGLANISGLSIPLNANTTQLLVVDANNIDCATTLSIVVPVPEIECPDDTDVATITQDVQFIEGELDVDDDTIDSLCWAADAEIGERYFDSLTVVANATDIYTFVLLSDMTAGNINEGWGAIFDGAYDGLMPCCNILDTTHAPNLAGSFTFDAPMLDFNNWNLGGYAPVGSMTIQLLGGQEYTLLTTSLQAGVTGEYQWAIFSQNGGQLLDGTQLPFPSQAGPVLYDLLCNDYEFLLDDMTYTGDATITASCGIDSSFFIDELLLNGDCEATVINRSFVVTDFQGNSFSCNQEITVNVPELDDVKMPPLTARFDCDEFFVEDGNGNPHPSVTGYPFVLTAFGVNVLDEDPYCNLQASYQDEEEEICESSSTIFRTWTITDECNPDEIRTYVQTIKIGDIEGPIVSCPTSNHYCPILEGDIMLFSTDPFDCTATIEVPMPEVSDVCSDQWTVVTEVVEYQIVGDDTVAVVLETLLPGDIRLITGIEIGDYKFRYIVTDDCGNTTITECPFRVADLSEPVAICDNGMNISVGGFGLARIYWHMVDDGSYDNCGIDSILIRRVYTSDPDDCTPLNNPIYSEWGPYVDLTCCDAGSFVTIELRVVDVNGNVNMCWMEVLVEDKTLPYCYGLEDVQADCGSLPVDFDPSDLSLLDSLFGEAHVYDNCAAETIQLDPIVELSDCGNGTITRRFVAIDLVGNISQDTFLQVVTIGGGNGGFDIQFPQDTVLTCGDIFTDTMAQVYYSGCDSITVSYVDQSVAPEGDECYRVLRTYSVINHCQYDGISAPVIIDRDEDCDGDEGDEDVWVLFRLDSTFIDADSLAYNLYPLAGTKNTICDGTTNPDGYWRTSFSNGYWQYTQVLYVYDSIAPVIGFVQPEPFCVFDEEGEDCEGMINYPFSVLDNCLPDSSWLADTFSFQVLLDADADGTIDIDVTDSVSITGNYPNYAIEGVFPVGVHALQLAVSDACGNTVVDSLPFEVVDCFVAAAKVYDGLVVELMPLSGDIDIDGDGDMDYAAIEIEVDYLLDGEQAMDCTGPISFSINKVGETPDIDKQSMFITCDDTSRLDIEIWSWDEANNPYSLQPDGTMGGRNHNMVESTITVQNMEDICDPFGLPTPDPQLANQDRLLDEDPVLYQNKPNPFFNTTTIGFYLPEAGRAEVAIYDVSGKEIKVVRGGYEAGYHEVEVQRSDVPAYGMFFYTLRTESFIATKQMILLE
jgi:uncharacterized repeat protein (TIGR01451 family)